MKRFWRLMRDLLLELSDQSAYQRHLIAHGTEHSAVEWQRFCDEKWQAKARRGRCC